jgi:hypothetical protein
MRKGAKKIETSKRSSLINPQYCIKKRAAGKCNKKYNFTLNMLPSPSPQPHHDAKMQKKMQVALFPPPPDKRTM